MDDSHYGDAYNLYVHQMGIFYKNNCVNIIKERQKHERKAK